MGIRVGAALAAALCMSAQAFTPFGFRSAEEIDNGRIFRWAREDPSEPLRLSFAIDSAFMAGADIAPGAARDAAIGALETWGSGLGAQLEFEEVDWAAVPNEGLGPPFEWEGPGFDEWYEDFLLPEDERQWPDERAGWGANIDIFSRPSGFEIDSTGSTYVMGDSILGFAILNRNSTQILSVDVYLNESQSWSVDGNGGFDVETVLVHEIGHGLGFDHPAEAVDQGSVNLSPSTFLPGFQWSTQDVMHPAYTGVKRHLTLDEIGGLLFFYTDHAGEGIVPGDLTGDGAVNATDLSVMLGVWGLDQALADLNGSGLVDAPDLAMLLANWTGAGGPPDMGGLELPAGGSHVDHEAAEQKARDQGLYGHPID